MGKKEKGRMSRICLTFAVYKNLCVVTVRSHQYSFVVYLFFGQARLAIYDFEKLAAS